VSILCVLIGQELALPGDRIEHLGTAGLLHDVGKIGIADVLLQKKGKLTPEERIVMNNHVYMGQSIVAAAGLDEEAEWILRHHEHLDGRGYPDGLTGTDIPLESRIIGVADAFEAMTATRPYSPARTVVEAFEELDRGTGTQFDGDCVRALRAALGSNLESPLGRLAQDADRNGHVPTAVAQVATG
jgi:HD-GYP domain-containing protein (c-di-GMP phosphodiesterase class II)